MAIQASTPVNNMLFVLTGERLIQANEDLAHESHAPYRKLARNLDELSDLVEKSIGSAARALPPQAGQNYVRAMRMFVDQGGTANLKQFSRQLDEVADNRVRTSYQIMETKWQIIAEVIRLIIELLVVFALSVFSSGAAAGRAAVAKARSRVLILTLMDTLMRHTHVLPILSEALEEAFQSFAVRLGMIAFTDSPFSPKGFDWKQIAQDGAFGAFAAAFITPIARSGQGAFDALKKSFKGTTPVKNVADDVIAKVGEKTGPSVINHTPGGKAGKFGTETAVPVQPAQGRHLSGGSLAFGEAGGESLAEVLGGGLFYGNWSTSTDTFVGAGLSNRSEHVLHTGAVGSGTWINTKFSVDQPAGTVNGPDAGLGAGGEDKDTTEKGTRPGVSGSGGSTHAGDGPSEPVVPIPTVSAGPTVPGGLDAGTRPAPGAEGPAAASDGSTGLGGTSVPQGATPTTPSSTAPPSLAPTTNTTNVPGNRPGAGQGENHDGTPAHDAGPEETDPDRTPPLAPTAVTPAAVTPVTATPPATTPTDVPAEAPHSGTAVPQPAPSG
ncbi:hypothetical protein PV408_01560, partial [Streptomyces sp. ME18-1-4]|nr:hypothetical protein [Streptomyces sp. ME18-1-4]